jgi:predicted transcriptional regulator
MAMTLRLTNDEAETLRRRADLEGRSMHDIARQAIREYVEQQSRNERFDGIFDHEIPGYVEAFLRRGE